MSLPAELRSVLTKARLATARSPSGKRDLVAKTEKQKLNAILEEIRETILSRTLVFTIGEDYKLVLEAGEGKLRGVVEVIPNTLHEADIEVKTSASKPQQRKAALRLLSEFAKADGKLEVEPKAPEVFSGSGIDGHSPSEIYDAEGAPDEEATATETPKATEEKVVDPSTPPPGSDTQSGQFYKTASEFSTTRAITAEDGGVASKSGEDQDLPLEYLVRTFASQIKMNSAFTDTAMPGPKAIFMGSQMDDMPSAICLDDGKSLVVATVASADVDQALDKAAAVLANTPED